MLWNSIAESPCPVNYTVMIAVKDENRNGFVLPFARLNENGRWMIADGLSTQNWLPLACGTVTHWTWYPCHPDENVNIMDYYLNRE